MSTERVDSQAVHGRVIVIEKNAAMRSLLEEVLFEFGLISAIFDNAEAAMDLLHSVHGTCPLIIADQGAPNSSQATHFLEAVKKLWPEIPTILTSGFAIEKLTIPPSTIYLQKPYSLAVFERTILEMLPTGFALPRDRQSPS